jgi:hypothetical protein
MTDTASIRFWRPAPEGVTELVCAYLEGREAPPHIHEEWQFAVLETPSKLSLGAFRRYSADAGDVTIVHPYEVHSEGGEVGAAPKWLMLYVPPSIVSRLYGGKAPRFPRPVVTDPVAAAELGELLRHSGDGTLPGADFLGRVTDWLREFLLAHAEDVIVPQRTPAVERARAYLQDRPTQSVTMPEVGAAASVTVSHLIRSFSKAVGLPQELPRAGTSGPRPAASSRGKAGDVGCIRVWLCRPVAPEPAVQGVSRGNAGRLPGGVPRPSEFPCPSGDERSLGGLGHSPILRPLPEQDIP